MMIKSLQDALFNWLTIKVVCDERPDDEAAKETEKMFHDLLVDEFNVENIQLEKDDTFYYIHFDRGDEREMKRFPRELAEFMLNQIEQEPEKYKNY